MDTIGTKCIKITCTFAKSGHQSFSAKLLHYIETYKECLVFLFRGERVDY
jgi:hypothetical protein